MEVNTALTGVPANHFEAWRRSYRKEVIKSILKYRLQDI